MEGQELPFYSTYIAMGLVIIAGIGFIALLRKLRKPNKTFMPDHHSKQRNDKGFFDDANTMNICYNCGSAICTCIQRLGR